MIGAMDDGGGMRILIPDSELDAAIRDMGEGAAGGLTIEQARLIVADVASCLGSAAAIGADGEFFASMASMTPPQDAASSNFAMRFLDFLLAELPKADFSESLEMGEIAGRVEHIRLWIQGPKAHQL